MTAHHGRNSPDDIDGPARCITARRGRDGASSDQTFVIPIQDAARPRGGDQHGIGIGEVGDPMYTHTTRGDHAVFAFDYKQLTSMENRSTVDPARPSPTITKNSRVTVAGGLRPRRLTPREVERCFGFADDYTLVPVGRQPAKDAPRYEALGNSMAVPVLSWIGRRLTAVDELVARRGSLAAA
jgi:site-specific DNA-cytosine methylase